jgi:hypothetical protein
LIGKNGKKKNKKKTADERPVNLDVLTVREVFVCVWVNACAKKKKIQSFADLIIKRKTRSNEYIKSPAQKILYYIMKWNLK